MHKNATKCNEILSKWCENKHGASKIIDTFETYQSLPPLPCKRAYLNPLHPALVSPPNPREDRRQAAQTRGHRAVDTARGRRRFLVSIDPLLISLCTTSFPSISHNSLTRFRPPLFFRAQRPTSTRSHCPPVRLRRVIARSPSYLVPANLATKVASILCFNWYDCRFSKSLITILFCRKNSRTPLRYHLLHLDLNTVVAFSELNEHRRHLAVAFQSRRITPSTSSSGEPPRFLPRPLDLDPRG
jgi:hypothetical protein